VNPNRLLSDFIKSYTGITQADVNDAPSFSAVAAHLAAFLGSAPVVGHNIGFALGFLAGKGLRLSNPRCDTWDMAFVLYPNMQDYALNSVASSLKVDHPRPHRALDDAIATTGIFTRMIEKASELDVFALAEMERMASRSGWVLSHVLRSLGSSVPASTGLRSSVGAMGVDAQELSARLQTGRALRANVRTRELDVDFVESLLKNGSPLSDAMPGFEERSEQVAMGRAVAEAINQGHRLIVEAGTGVGKSLAYLLPSAMYASMNNKRVVVSTNTINLQEQLVGKDIPVLVNALSKVEDITSDEIRFTQLKGRANYLCLRKWGRLRSSDPLADNEARMLSKIMVWLKDTSTGDRSEINMGNRTSAAPWDNLSAQGAAECLSQGGPCFYRAARERAAASHIVVVNHALLLSDLTAGGGLIPEYDVLIIDEAHHLEDEATRHFGFEIAQSRLDDHIQSLSGDRGLLNESINAFRGSNAAASRRETVEKTAAEITEIVPRVRDNAARMFAQLSALIYNGPNSSQREQDIRVVPGTRAQPGWSDLEIQWENVDLSFMELGRRLDALRTALEGLENANLVNYEGLVMELANVIQANADLRQWLKEFVAEPKADGIYWVSRYARTGELTLHMAPLHVGETLNSELFSKKECVVMTSATLSTNGTFDHVIQRTGFEDAEQLLLGSPFDYPKAAVLYVPRDMPEPNSWAYQTAMEETITAAALTARGRTMALFTSYASLNTTATAIRGKLQAKGIDILAQGTDGTPQQIVSRFLDKPESVILGTASFWEGVDLAGDSLQVLIVARLPFSVPSDPVFAARSELYDNAFNQYAVPQAILRLRQGFGRLIRTKSDKGVAIILDNRVASRSYGRAFLKSLPPVGIKMSNLNDLPTNIKQWIGA
jgi:DNA polymerase-3 subunit epsilon/ATP-dependent DNA helicase DinG